MANEHGYLLKKNLKYFCLNFVNAKEGILCKESPVKQKFKFLYYSRAIQVMCCLKIGGPPSKFEIFDA